jgi:hypothetical protein
MAFGARLAHGEGSEGGASGASDGTGEAGVATFLYERSVMESLFFALGWGGEASPENKVL